MASLSSSSPAPVISSQSWKYDVFLSFRGEDTRKTFVDHLYMALEQQGIYTYKDDETLPRGNSIRPSLLKAIEESQIAVVIFSENYADSSWCLDELACIMKCKKTKGQIVMPIFYDVDPSEVRKKKRKYGEAFDNHELENKKKIKSWRQAFVDDPWGWLSAPREQSRKYHEALAKHQLENNKKVESWRKALVDASNISGWDPKHVANGHEAKVIKEIVDQISHSLKLVIPSTNGNLIGITARVQGLKSELRIGLGGVHMVGIWGVGGGGKTTLASSVYNEISRKFDGCCFVENIREESSKNGLEKLQEKILYGILKQKQVQAGRVEEGKRMIMSRLCHRKVLIVSDDVDCIEQLKALAGSHDWFGEGSRIIITTRDEHVLTAHRVDVIHNISLLNNDEAMELFCKHAPQGHNPIEDYELLSKDVVAYAGGIPLALTVLGCFLCDKGINEWRSALARLKKIPDTNIVEKLKISFDGLTKDEKELFLDIACFFRGRYKNEGMMTMLDACGFHPVIGIKVLIQKTLITISDGRFDMHDLVQEMGHHIVRGEHPSNPGKHSRIWKEEDVVKICAMDATTELDMIEAIRFQDNGYSSVELVPQIVVNMKNLRWIDWRGNLATPFPTKFPSVELCCLRLDGISHKQLWEGYKHLPSLKVMELYGLKNLIKTPDFDGLPNLERFILHDSPYIEEIHPSIRRLKVMELYGLENLIKTPDFDGLPNLERFILHDSLHIEEIHPSIQRLENLIFLSIDDCPSLKIFPPVTQLNKLKTFSLSDCPKIVKLQQQNMNNLPHLHLDNSEKEVASCKKNSTNFSVTCLTCGDTEVKKPREDFIDVEKCCLEEPFLPHSNMNHHTMLQFFSKGLRNLHLWYCNLGDKETRSAVWDLPNLEKLNLSGNNFSQLNFSLFRLPRLKWLNVSGCEKLVELSELPSSIVVLIADWCSSLESLRDVSNCKLLWNLSLRMENKLSPLVGDILLDSMLQGIALEGHFVSVALDHLKIPKRFVESSCESGRTQR
ncbi:TMV resistance protein N isoform X3 [Lactuca sativa]|uniref:TMV resistance protein N isoform X3 n=1 Tax=Lactuca sativa TaxID=4236 RepID=UPI000CD9899B|nr:TMV resistance protein N isoform X3 [Lactuca sativa]